MDPAAQLLADHYQKTYELTYELWRQRNRIFLLLLGSIAAATLLTFNPLETRPLLLDWIAKNLGVTQADRINELRQTFPFGILQGIILLGIFYLVVNLYNRSLYVLRSYQYLGTLESEIRQRLGLATDAVSFSRESAFYWRQRAFLLGTVKWVYIVLLGGLLLAFLGGRMYYDARYSSPWIVLVDVAVSVPTLLYFGAYAASSVGLDKEASRADMPAAR